MDPLSLNSGVGARQKFQKSLMCSCSGMAEDGEDRINVFEIVDDGRTRETPFVFCFEALTCDGSARTRVFDHVALVENDAEEFLIMLVGVTNPRTFMTYNSVKHAPDLLILLFKPDFTFFA